MDIGLAEFVWERAGDCCEYCRMPQIYDELPFEIDHVIAEQHGGKTVANNLVLGINAAHRVRHRAQLLAEGVFPPVS